MQTPQLMAWVHSLDYRNMVMIGDQLLLHREPSQRLSQDTQIEKEALALTWSCEKFILGRLVQLETDHKPLVPILGLKSQDSLLPRVLRFFAFFTPLEKVCILQTPFLEHRSREKKLPY